MIRYYLFYELNFSQMIRDGGMGTDGSYWYGNPNSGNGWGMSVDFFLELIEGTGDGSGYGATSGNGWSD